MGSQRRDPVIDVSRALVVPGFMSENELRWLATMASGRQFVVEVGCWMGRTTKVLAEHAARVLAVDTWNGSQELTYLLDGLPKNALYNNWLLYTHENKNVIACRLPSREAARRLKSFGMVMEGQRVVGMPAFDMVFIDAAHDYESVKADILEWIPCIVDGGILCGHDFHHPPVRQVIRELFGPEHEKNNPDTRMWCVEIRWQKA